MPPDLGGDSSMRSTTGSRAAAIVAALVLCTPLVAAAQPTGAKLRPAPAFPPKELAAPPTNGWPTNGGSLYNQRYSPLTRINRSNVATLKPSWRVSLNGSGIGSKYSGQAQPIVYDGVVYIVTGADDVFAVSVDTGQILWTYQAKLDE